MLARLRSEDPETRWLAAEDLARYGDRSALAPLEDVALHDEGSFLQEGAFVDNTVHVHRAALDALRSLYARVVPTPEDIARVRAHLADETLRSDRREALGAALGPAAADVAGALATAPEPALRLLACNVLGHARRERSNHALWHADEEVRLEAARQDAYRSNLMRDALARFPDEPSPRVRLALSELWLRYRARMDGWLKSWELVDLLTDRDPAIHTPVARHVIDTARRRATWIDDPGSLGKTRDRLRALLDEAPAVAPVLREALSLIEKAHAPFDKTHARDRAPGTGDSE